jgi:outer membrane protein assembly factor BamD
MPSFRPSPRVRRGATLAALSAAAAASAACSRAFNAARFRNAPDLYRASVQRFERRKWDDALQGFDRLASQLPTRDTLLPRVYFYQGQAHARKGEHLLAAQAYARIGDAFPDDSLADDALFQQGREYQRLWPKPTRDAQYGQTAAATYRQLVQLYPESPLVAAANQQIAALQQQFAAKDLEAGLHYLRRKAYDPALIYFKDVVRLYPGTPAARAAYLRMIQAYRAIRYTEEITESCADMRRTYPGDGEVQRACGAAPVASAPASSPPAASTPAGTTTPSSTPAPTTPATPPTATPAPTPAG